MIPFERKNLILDTLRKGPVYIEQLVTLLNVSEVTVRRDLKALEEDGLIERFHGGVAKLTDTSKETAMDLRETLYVAQKEKIGKFAASFVANGDVVFIDSGTTTKTMIKYLRTKKNISIVTNGFRNIEEIKKYNLQATLVGGNLKWETYAFIGPIASKIISMFFFDKCFLGTNGICHEFGLSNADPFESQIKAQVIKQAKAAYIVSDHTKFNAKSAFKFANIDDVIIITDKLPKNYKNCENIITALD